MTFFITFIVAFALLTAVFALKMRELKSGKVFCAGVRARIDLSLHILARALRARATSLKHRISISNILHKLAHSIILLFARLANFAGRKAHALAVRISRSAQKHEMCEDYKSGSSQFLQNVPQHKEELDIDAIKRETRLE